MTTEHPAPQRLHVRANDRDWLLERPADLESLWRGLDETAPKAEDHIPYWVELWPATLALCTWLGRRAELLPGARCLDLGCGLGLSALVAADLGALVVGMDHEHGALVHAARNARLNHVPQPLWVRMNWEHPGLAPRAFDYIWGGDIFYEQRFFEPLEALLLRCLAPGGKIWFGDPERTVSRDVWARFARRGWTVRNLEQVVVPFEGARMTVNVWELRGQ
ncbi:MAG: methyltransferase domain-containing protein [Deltaproteobacteria bacterium]|nr:methyltransferase domain-containing protein [Deltaproteobacteria bacterium]